MPALFRKATVRQFTVITAPVFVIALLGSDYSLGQQQASPEQQRTDSRGNVIEEVVVTANRRPQRIPEIARSVLVLDELVLEENLAKTPNIGDLLGTSVPGFGPPSETDISRVLTLRGREVQYLIDGVPVQFNGGAGYGGFALAKFDPEIIGRVEVLYGPTAVYGSGATGGVIQYFTRSAQDGDPFQLRVRIQATTFFEDFADRDSTSYKYTVGASGDMGRFDYLASYSFDDQRGLIDGAGDLVNPVFYGFTEEDF
ncbi:MAG: TonB-dependent receptor plug domain-containing protein, partial [Pseudomonadota bacterium]